MYVDKICGFFKLGELVILWIESSKCKGIIIIIIIIMTIIITTMLFPNQYSVFFSRIKRRIKGQLKKLTSVLTRLQREIPSEDYQL